MNAHEQAEKLWAAAAEAAFVLERCASERPSVLISSKLSREVASLIAAKAEVPLRFDTYMSADGEWHTLWSFYVQVRGVEIRGQGARPATTEEIAVAKAEGSR